MARSIALLLLVAMLLGNLANAGQQGASQLSLVARSTARPAIPAITPEQQQWLNARHELVIGTSAPDYPPFDISSGGRDYQGLTAEYASLLGKALDLPVRVLRYPSRQTALQALKQGDIDLLGSANGYDANYEGVVLSHAYAIDQPVLVTREDEHRALDTGLSGMRLGMLYHYLPRKEVLSVYPDARTLASG